jgi:formate dehydrogenase major subunit
VIQGSNMAECHPVGFQWVVEAQQRGATVIHVDPRFTRTSAIADLHVPLRAGSDIAFLGGIVRYIIENHRWFDDYVKAYTNASAIIHDDFRDTEDLGGLFSGWDPDTQQYDHDSWQYAGHTSPEHARGSSSAAAGEAGGGGGAQPIAGRAPEQDPTLQDPRCVFQIVRRHFQRYTPEMVESICGVPQDLFLRVCEALCDNSGRERTGAFCYAVGWTQHTVGVQYIRTAAIIQLLLGNMGRPGGGILALRGHASIQGSTDIPTLYDLLPGYLPMPHAGQHESLDAYVKADRAKQGYWGNLGSYVVSLLKAYWGERATAENDFCWGYLPRVNGDHSAYQTALGMLDGTVKGYFLLGQNPAVGSANGGLHRRALASLEWLVVRDFSEIESASFWYDAPEIETGELRTDDIETEVFFLPAAAHTEKSGTFTNTQRLLQWHEAAVEPRGDARSDLWFMFHLGRRIRSKLLASTDERDRPLLELTWDYPTEGPLEEPSAEAVLAEINGFGSDGAPLSSYTELADDGSTSCGCWIYCGCMAEGKNLPRRRVPASEQSYVAPDWGWAWPANRRMLYNRASADPDGNPWSERKRYVWWDPAARRWTGVDVPDFEPEKAPHHVPPHGATGPDAIAGNDPFIMQADGKGWLYAPTGVRDGPLPTHYEPHESVVANALYNTEASPARQQVAHEGNPYNPTYGADGATAYPYVVTTYRLTEHHTAGAMTRTVPHLAELQPEMFCEVSPALAAERGLTNGGWATIITSRAAIEARVLVTDRIASLQIQGRTVHQVGLPYHWGSQGLSVGDSANDLLPLVLDPTVHIQESKVATCDVRPGRRPRGRARQDLVDGYPRRQEKGAS